MKNTHQHLELLKTIEPNGLQGLKFYTAGLNSLERRDNLHISVSDKCGDFLVSTAIAYKTLTIDHIKENDNVYKFVPPTRHRQGEINQVKCPTEVTYRNQLNAERDSIERQCNELWKEIVEMRSIDNKFAMLFYSHNTTLPTLYTLVKTHKVPPGVGISYKRLEELKVRPNVSCSGSPTERLATLVTRIITPLLNFIPSHLKNIHQYLELLKTIEPSGLQGLKFYTADVATLFTNINIGRCIENVLELAEEHWGEIPTYGIKLVDLHKLLEIVLGNSYFTFNQRLYEQIYGAFIGCSVSPHVSLLLYTSLKKRASTFYNDINFLSSPIGLFYRRYVDDSGSLARTKEEAVENCKKISERDVDGRIRWEVDFPDDNQYTPFFWILKLKSIQMESYLRHTTESPEVKVSR